MSRAPFIRRTLPVVVRGLSLGTLTAGVDGVLVGLVWLGRALTGVKTGSQLIKHVVSKKKKKKKTKKAGEKTYLWPSFGPVIAAVFVVAYFVPYR